MFYFLKPIVTIVAPHITYWTIIRNAQLWICGSVFNPLSNQRKDTDDDMTYRPSSQWYPLNGEKWKYQYRLI